jgi:peptidoglycan/xylan/chitin deacetylase (PgdA/CDA1 family)
VFFHADLKGADLPPGTLCLTYDDGPGEHTAELGRYLHAEGIAATFFVIGRHALGHEDLLGRLRAGGHLVGNHTWSHPGLVALAQAGGDVVGEIERTDRLIRPFVDGPTVLFRAPYGNWREVDESGRDRPTSVVCDVVNQSGKFDHCVGPVNWDVVAEDWECWRQGVAPEEAARRYAAEAGRVGRGIVLMHDSSEDPAMRPRNRTMEMTKLFVPLLKAKGFRFVRLDEVPGVRAAMQAAGAGGR